MGLWLLRTFAKKMMSSKNIFFSLLASSHRHCEWFFWFHLVCLWILWIFQAMISFDSLKIFHNDFYFFLRCLLILLIHSQLVRHSATKYFKLPQSMRWEEWNKKKELLETEKFVVSRIRFSFLQLSDFEIFPFNFFLLFYCEYFFYMMMRSQYDRESFNCARIS